VAAWLPRFRAFDARPPEPEEAQEAGAPT
jgi:hypothetical protein